MIRDVAAGVVFAILYGVAVRVFVVLRAQRESARWHPRGLALSTAIGGLAFYAAQQIRMPHFPEILDLAAFAIMCLGASAIPVLFELGVVLPARWASRTSFRAPQPQPPHQGPPPNPSDTSPDPSLQRTPPG